MIELVIGFVLGCIASMLATIFLNAIPAYRQWPILALLRNPRLFVQLRCNTEQRKIRVLINRLFRAWGEKDSQKYLSCWATDAVRVIGPTNTVEDRLPEIKSGFAHSCSRYHTIRVLSVVIEDIDIQESRPNEAVVKVHYRFQLVREPDLLPVCEEATELYVLRHTEHEGWKIASNLDHSKDVTK